MEANGTEISRKKNPRIVDIQYANHPTQNLGNSGSIITEMERKFLVTNPSKLLVACFSSNSGKC